MDCGQAPIKKRIFRGSSSQTVLTALGSKPATRPSQYKHWTDDNMAKALDSVTNKGMSVRKAAPYYNVPKSTVGDRVSGRIQHGSVSGPPKYLTNEEQWRIQG